MAADDRTEKPTSRRIRDARKKGQIARSGDLGQAASLAAALAVLGFVGARYMQASADLVVRGVARMGMTPGHDITGGEVSGLVVQSAASLGLLVGPIALAAAAGAVAMQVAQGGLNFASEALQPKFNRLNPISGLSQLGFKKGGVQTVKAVLVFAVVSYLAYPVLRTHILASEQLTLMAPFDAAAVVWADARGLLWKTVFFFGVLGAADYLWQRHQWLDGLKMTKQEVKDDMKMAEGSPEIKNRIRKVMFESFRRRMMAAVPTATVVITNPTHYAVALEYRRSAMFAPVVVAKGKDHLAQSIKAVAREHGVPMVENVPLAQALYKSVEVGEAIPGNLFEAVAEVLAYLIRLKQLTLN
jgi:flagellar biosynthetic protein FlhB